MEQLGVGTGGSCDVAGLSLPLCPGAADVSAQFSPTDGFGAVASCSIHSKKDKKTLQSFLTVGIVCSSCQGGRCSTGTGSWGILASWECHQEAGAGHRALGRGQWQPGTLGAAPSTPREHRQCQGSRRLPGKCPRGRDGQGCAPCPARKRLFPPCQVPAQLHLCSCLGTVSPGSSRSFE